MRARKRPLEEPVGEVSGSLEQLAFVQQLLQSQLASASAPSPQSSYALATLSPSASAFASASAATGAGAAASNAQQLQQLGLLLVHPFFSLPTPLSCS